MIGAQNTPRLRNCQVSTRKSVVLLSGGLDSATLAFWLAEQGHTIECLYLDYEQGHTNAERECAISIAKRLDANLNIVETPRPRDSLKNYFPLLNGEAALLTDAVSLCTMAVPFASASRADAIYLGVNVDDWKAHPLLQVRFFRGIEKIARLSLGNNLRLLTPFLNKDKMSIVKIGLKLGVPFASTWSCSVNVKTHCGLCSDCIARKRAFSEVGLVDPTRYENKS
jgi:7-cyano-7-deazaguanine synthase